MSSDRVNFFGLSEDKLYYDEKKKRFVNTKDAPGHIHRQYYQGHFKDVSSDLAVPKLGFFHLRVNQLCCF